MGGKRIMLRFLLVFSLMLLGQASNAIEVKDVILLQNNMESKIQPILDKYLGKDKAMAKVQIFLKDTTVKNYFYENSKDQKNNTPLKTEQLKKSKNLPGYSAFLAAKQKEVVKEEIYDSSSQAEKQSYSVEQKKEIDKYSITLIVDASIKKENAENAKKLIWNILKLNKQSGDEIIIETVNFAPKEAFAVRVKNSLLADNNLEAFAKYFLIFLFLSVLIFTVFVFAWILTYTKEKIKEKTQERNIYHKEIVQQNDNKDKKKNKEEEKDDTLDLDFLKDKPEVEFENRENLFPFITEANISKIAYLLSNDNIDNIVTVITLIKPEFASKIFENFDLELQKKVMFALSSEILLFPEKVKKVEERIRWELDYLVGGQSFTLKMFDYLDSEVGKNMLEAMEKEDKDLAQKISKKLYIYEDIQYVEKRYLQYIVKTVGVKEFSISLNESDEAFIKSLYPKLTEGMVEEIEQYIKLLGKQPKTKISQARFEVVNLIKKLNKEGLVPSKGNLVSRAKEIEDKSRERNNSNKEVIDVQVSEVKDEVTKIAQELPEAGLESPEVKLEVTEIKQEDKKLQDELVVENISEAFDSASKNESKPVIGLEEKIADIKTEIMQTELAKDKVVNDDFYVAEPIKRLEEDKVETKEEKVLNVDEPKKLEAKIDQIVDLAKDKKVEKIEIKSKPILEESKKIEASKEELAVAKVKEEKKDNIIDITKNDKVLSDNENELNIKMMLNQIIEKNELSGGVTGKKISNSSEISSTEPKKRKMWF